MKEKESRCICIMLILFLSSCVGVGVPVASDPHEMLVSSYEMMNQNRPIPAKKLADSAFEKYKEQNDINGMAEALHTLGNLYKHGGFDVQIYNNEFTDYDKSEKYFREAAKLYQSVSNYEGLIKSYFGIANVHSIKGEFEKACAAYDKSGMYYEEMLINDSSQKEKINILTGPNNFPEMLKAFKEKYNCN